MFRHTERDFQKRHHDLGFAIKLVNLEYLIQLAYSVILVYYLMISQK